MITFRIRPNIDYNVIFVKIKGQTSSILQQTHVFVFLKPKIVFLFYFLRIKNYFKKHLYAHMIPRTYDWS